MLRAAGDQAGVDPAAGEHSRPVTEPGAGELSLVRAGAGDQSRWEAGGATGPRAAERPAEEAER